MHSMLKMIAFSITPHTEHLVSCSGKGSGLCHLPASITDVYDLLLHVTMMLNTNLMFQDCQSALHLAAKQGHHEVVKRLLMVGVDVDDREAVCSSLF